MMITPALSGLIAAAVHASLSETLRFFVLCEGVVAFTQVETDGHTGQIKSLPQRVRQILHIRFRQVFGF